MKGENIMPLPYNITMPYTGNNPWINAQTGSNMQTQSYPTSNNTFVWVQGLEAAKAYPVAPGNQVLLFDSDAPVFYIKHADQTGRPLPLEIYDFKKRESVETLPDVKVTYTDFATKDDVRAIIREELSAFKFAPKRYEPKQKEEK